MVDSDDTDWLGEGWGGGRGGEGGGGITWSHGIVMVSYNDPDW